MKKLLLIFMLLSAICASAQQASEKGTIQGKIVDDLGDVINGAAIVVGEDSRSAQSDYDGKFEIEASLGEQLSVSKKGYEAKTVEITAASMTIELKEIFTSNFETDKSVPFANGIVEGVVVDENNKPLVATAVLLRGKAGVGVSTKEDGTFSIKVEDNDVVQIAYLGYEMQKIPVSDIKGKITVKMAVALSDTQAKVDVDESLLKKGNTSKEEMAKYVEILSQQKKVIDAASGRN